MTGAWQSPAIESAYKSAAGSATSVPPAQDGSSPDAAGDNKAPQGGGDAAAQYTIQTGPTRFAPMQAAPPSSITQTNTKALYPTSGFTVSPSYWATPEAQTTITTSRTVTLATKENDVSDGQIFGHGVRESFARLLFRVENFG